MNSAEILKKLRVYRTRHIYQLGCTASDQLNIHAQQNRAFNLAFALQEEVLHEGMDVAVIGAGIAGVTAASALAAAGAQVTLYDSKTAVMHLQSGNQTRFLHPNISLWPRRSFGYPVTHLPFLNWRAETAGSVVAQLLKQWIVHKGVYETQIRTKFGCTIREVLFDPDDENLVILRKAKGTDTCRILVIAAGYGIERRPMSRTPSYWRNDDLAQPIITSEKRRTYLVSGSGDGGLTEVLRLTIREFHHQRFIQAVMFDQWLFKQANNVQKRLRLNRDKPQLVWNRFMSSRSRHRIEPSFLQLKRNDTIVYLNSRGDFPSTSNAQILHRLCVALLIRRGIVKYIPGRLTDVYENGNEKKIARIDGPSGQSFIEVDEVIERHGTNPTLDKLFPRDRQLFNRLRDSWRDTVDQTWVPSFDREFLADEFRRSYLERAYKIGFLLMPTDSLGDLVSQVLENLDFDELPESIQAWIEDNGAGGVTEPWLNRDFTLTVEDCDILRHGGRDFPDFIYSWRQYKPQQQLLAERGDPPIRDRCLFLSTNSRRLIEHLLRLDQLPYHVFRIFPADTFEPYLAEHFPPPAGTDREQPRPTPLVNFDTHVFLLTHDSDARMDAENDDDYFEVQCIDGMLQAHSLLRLPVLLELLMNTWPTTKVHGMGWAIVRTQHDNQNDHDGNRLLEWNP
ncbi:MAG: FAD-dependent oxidoreductase [Bacteroidetes bacterium]|nr:FAD-dependent oxidoreductase [Bacteroidota bacterium]